MSYALESYYEVLGLIPSATQEDIKSQYKQLVRTHHPDRFVDPDEKAVAEEHLKSINEAYRVLSSQAVQGQLVKYMQQELGLAVTPSLLDFGLLERRQQRNATFQVQFEKDVESVDFVPSEENSWFRVSRVSHIYGNDRASLEFEVEADSTGLPAQTYQGWIDVYLDSTMTRMPLTMHVAQGELLTGISLPKLSQLRLPRAWALALTFVLALLIFTTTFAFTSTRSFMQLQLNASPANSSANSLGNVIGHHTNQLYFSLLDQGTPSIYTALSQNAALPLLLTKGTQAAVLADEQLVAYLDTEAEPHQIVLWDQSTDSTQQISANEATMTDLTWSSDGQHLAYLVGRGQETRIGVYDRVQEQEYYLPGEVTAGVSDFA
ncbi:MAG: DnaJ domain-containing protein [Caldilineaceae bacterium]|nr:DnaJ domain-containing protein [Caldilineaceae bacterium]